MEESSRLEKTNQSAKFEGFSARPSFDGHKELIFLDPEMQRRYLAQAEP